MRRRIAAVACGLAAALVLSGCTVAAPIDASPSIARTVEIPGGRKMYLECAGSGSPRVVLISGQRGSAQEWSMVAAGVSSPPVFAQIAQHTRVCAYDRPGTPVGNGFSRSDPAPQPTTAAAMADDLAALLVAAGETGPTVIAAHSAGGLAGLLYAARHPDDVDGLVFVDATSTGLRAAETPAQWRIQLELLSGDLRDSLAEYPDIERIDFDTSFDQVLAAPPLRQMPLVVLSADRPWGPILRQMHDAGTLPPDVPADFGYVIDHASAEGQAGLASLVEGSIHITRTDSGHDVHQEQPDLVSIQILRVVDRVRAGDDTAE
ncbi:alpha/beta hydrolase [Microbacterium sp. X-17]|uniref:alpha/beta fold hydrolase n=1 Tax=Microbacterium sp. X-17 TaxID=3144404 RepID=UPI0031F4AF77